MYSERTPDKAHTKRLFVPKGWRSTLVPVQQTHKRSTARTRNTTYSDARVETRGLERWLFQRIGVHNSSFRASGTLFRPSRTPGTHVVHINTCRQNNHLGKKRLVAHPPIQSETLKRQNRKQHWKMETVQCIVQNNQLHVHKTGRPCVKSLAQSMTVSSYLRPH